MQSDPGAGVPHTGGTDDEVWRDLVARLEEAGDAFMDDAGLPDGAVPVTDAEGDHAGPNAAGPKTVLDFDPLGVWQHQRQPAPREPSAAGHLDPAAPGPRDYEAADGDEDFVPEELPSLSTADPAIMASWIGAAGGPLFLVFSAIFWRQIPLLLVLGVVVAFVAGTGYLLYRLPNTRDHDSGDGAVV